MRSLPLLVVLGLLACDEGSDPSDPSVDPIPVAEVDPAEPTLAVRMRLGFTALDATVDTVSVRIVPYGAGGEALPMIEINPTPALAEWGREVQAEVAHGRLHPDPLGRAAGAAHAPSRRRPPG